MPVSKNRKEHKTFKKQVNNIKNKTKKMNQQIPQMPPVRQIPVWNPTDKIEITGYEWEAIYNGLVQLQGLQQAAQSVMSRNILNGVIQMDFEKLNAKTLQYEPMTDEEKAPYLKQFKQTVEAVKNPPKEEPSVIITDAEAGK